MHYKEMHKRKLCPVYWTRPYYGNTEGILRPPSNLTHRPTWNNEHAHQSRAARMKAEPAPVQVKKEIRASPASTRACDRSHAPLHPMSNAAFNRHAKARKSTHKKSKFKSLETKLTFQIEPEWQRILQRAASPVRQNAEFAAKWDAEMQREKLHYQPGEAEPYAIIDTRSDMERCEQA